MRAHRFILATIALFSCGLWASAQTGMTGSTGSTGTSSGGLGTSGSSTGFGSSSSGGFGGGLSGGLGSSGGGSSGSPFLQSGTGGTSGSILTGYEPGALGQAGKAGVKSTTTSDLFARYYVNPIAIGNVTPGSTTAITQFGLPMYTSLYPGTQITSPFSNANVNAVARVTPAGGASNLQPNNFGSANSYRPPPTYITNIGFKYQPPAPTQMQATIQNVLARSTDLPKDLDVSLDGRTVVLRGNVTDLAQRRLAENLVKLTPGVGPVRNELQVNAPAKSGQ